MIVLLGCGPLPGCQWQMKVYIYRDSLLKMVIFLVVTGILGGGHIQSIAIFIFICLFIYIYIYIDGASINHLLAVVSFRCLQVSAYIPTNEALYHSDKYS